MRKLMMLVVICASCVGLMENQSTPISPGLRVGKRVDISVVQTYSNLEEYVNQGARIRISNNTGAVRDIEVTCRFLRGDRSVISENVIIVREILAYSQRWDFVWSSRNSPWLSIVECETAPAFAAD